MSCPGCCLAAFSVALKFVRLWYNFGGKRHYGDLRKVLTRNEVHCLSIGVQNIEHGTRVNMSDTIPANMRLC